MAENNPGRRTRDNPGTQGNWDSSLQESGRTDGTQSNKDAQNPGQTQVKIRRFLPEKEGHSGSSHTGQSDTGGPDIADDDEDLGGRSRGR